MTHRARGHQRDPIVLGIVLITIGIGAFALNAYPESGSFIVAIIGLGLIGVFMATRAYAALVPGAIMAGLGLGIALTANSTIDDSGALIVGGLGLGFIAIWVLTGLFHVEEHHFWPLIPGGILLAVGAMLGVGGLAIDLLAWWPVLLIAVGVVVLGRELLVRRQG
jgi:hypothetical protein